MMRVRGAAGGCCITAIPVTRFCRSLPWNADRGAAIVTRGLGSGGQSVIPLIVRLPMVVAFVAVRRPWALAAGAALLTPAFHEHSFVLFLPAAILLIESIRSRQGMESFARDTAATPTLALALAPHARD